MGNEQVTEVIEQVAPVETVIDGGEVQKTEVELQAENEAAVAAQAAEEQAAIDSAKKEGGVNKRFSDLTKAAKAAQEREEAAQRRLDLALAALERTSPKPDAVVKTVVVEDPAPVAPEFETPEQYQKDMAIYAQKLAERSARLAVKANEAEQAILRAESESRLQAQARFKAYQVRTEAFKKETPDYDDVIGNNDKVTITIAMATAIGDLGDTGPKVAYYLGKNPQEAERIAKLPLNQQALEIGRLEYKATAAPKIQKTNAPAPIRPIVGGATPATKDLSEMSMEEYAASRRKSG
jgi:hypothetical protein